MYIHIIECELFPKNVVKIITSDDSRETIENYHRLLYQTENISVTTYNHDITRDLSRLFTNVFDCLEKYCNTSEQLCNFYYFFGKEDKSTEEYFNLMNQKIKELIQLIGELRTPPNLNNMQNMEDNMSSNDLKLPEKTENPTPSESSWSVLSILSKNTENKEENSNSDPETPESDANSENSENLDEEEKVEERTSELKNKLRPRMNENMIKVDMLFEQYGKDLHGNPLLIYDWLENPKDSKLTDMCRKMLMHAKKSEASNNGLAWGNPGVKHKETQKENVTILTEEKVNVKEDWKQLVTCLPPTLEAWRGMIDTLDKHEVDIDLDNTGLEYKFDIDDLKVEQIHETVSEFDGTGFGSSCRQEEEEADSDSDSDYDPWNDNIEDKMRVALVFNSLLNVHTVIYDRNVIDNIIYSSNFCEYVVVSEYLIQNESVIKQMISAKIRKSKEMSESVMDQIIRDVENFMNNDNDFDDSEIEKIDMFLLRRNNTQRTQVVLENIVRKFLKRSCIVKRGERVRSSDLFYNFTNYLKDKYYKAAIFINKNEFTPIVKKCGYHTKRFQDGVYWMDMTLKTKKDNTFSMIDLPVTNPEYHYTDSSIFLDPDKPYPSPWKKSGRANARLERKRNTETKYRNEIHKDSNNKTITEGATDNLPTFTEVSMSTFLDADHHLEQIKDNIEIGYKNKSSKNSILNFMKESSIKSKL